MMYNIKLYDPVDKKTQDTNNRVQSMSISEKLDNEVTTFRINCKNIYIVHLYNHAEIYKNNSLFLSGIILNQLDSDGGLINYKLTSFEGEDWGHIFTKRVVAETYLQSGVQGGRPDLILKHMLKKYAPEFTINNVRVCNSIIEKIQFPYITLKDAIEGIMDLLPDWHYYVDRNKDFHFFYKYERDGTTFTKDNILVKTLKVEYSGQEHTNKVWIVGRKQASPKDIEQYYTGDGTQRYFSLAYEPNDTRIYVNGKEKDSSLEGNDNGNRDFLINKTERVFYIPAYRTPYTGPIKAVYKPTKQFIDMYENPADIKVFGLMEKVVKNSNITEKLEARKFGMAEVKKQSTIKRKISFRSREDVNIGQRCRVSIHTEYWNIEGYFLVKAVNRDITAADELISFELEEILA